MSGQIAEETRESVTEQARRRADATAWQRPDEREFDRLLHERGLRATPQRQLIFRIVTARRQHLTAADVQRRLARIAPGISLPTVYSTLDLFVDLGVVRRISLPEGSVLYDSEVSRPHAHLVCRRCGKIFDLDIQPLHAADASAAAREGFTVDSADLVLQGICASCRDREQRG